MVQFSAAHGNSFRAFMLKQMTRKMTQREIAEAQQLAREWKPSDQATRLLSRSPTKPDGYEEADGKLASISAPELSRRS